MIGIVDVEVQAANPQMPLCPFVAFVGSPSSVRVRNVPGNIGSWNITKVYVSANYPDNSIQSRECTRVGEIYVGTLPACDTAGKGANGFVVSADGVDENGNAVTGYVLGKGGLEILDADGAITPGVTTHYVHGLDEQPSDPHEYDIYKDGDTWKIYFNGAWGPLAPAPATLDDAVTRTSANGVKSSGIWSALWGALASLPTGFTSLYDWVVDQLSGKADKAYVDAKSYIKSPDGNTVVSADNDGVAKVTMPKLGYGNASVFFPSGFKITDGVATFTGNGETIEFYGPISSTAPGVASIFDFWVPYEYKDVTDFDPSNQQIWCLTGSKGSNLPSELMYYTGPYFIISNWDSATQTLTVGYGEVTGDPPTMTREVVPSTETKTVATTDQIPSVPTPYTSNPKMDGFASPGLSSNFSRGDHRHPTDTSRAADDAVVKLTGNQTILGLKSFYSGITIENGADIDFTAGGRVIIRTMSGAMAIFNNDGIDYSTDGGLNYVHFDWPSASGTLALTAGTGHAGNLAALDANGNPTDAGYHFEVRNGIPCIVQYT